MTKKIVDVRMKSESVPLQDNSKYGYKQKLRSFLWQINRQRDNRNKVNRKEVLSSHRMGLSYSFKEKKWNYVIADAEEFKLGLQ